MANNCYYEMKVVAKDMAVIDRLLSIMDYKDDEFFLDRVFDVSKSEEMDADGLCSAILYGNVAWCSSRWFKDEEEEDTHPVLEYGKDENGNVDFDKKVYGKSHYISLDRLCRVLGIAVEIYSQEPGMGFQEHIMCNPDGQSVVDSVSWTERYEDDDYENEGGYDNWGSFKPEVEIFGWKPE